MVARIKLLQMSVVLILVATFLAIVPLRERSSDSAFTQAHAKGLPTCATTLHPIAFKLRAQRFSTFTDDAILSS